VAWGGLLLYFLNIVWGLPLWVAIIISVAGVSIVAIFCQVICVETVRDSPHLVPVLTCLFAGVVLDSLSSISLEGNIMSIPPFSGGATMNIFGAGLAPQSLWVLGVIGIKLLPA